MGDVDDTLVHRDAGAESEDQNGNDEAPEVELAAIAEGVRLSGRFLAAWRPHISSSWLVESTTLCTPSVSIAEEPVIAAATNFDTAIPRFAQKRDDERPGAGGRGAHRPANPVNVAKVTESSAFPVTI